jgi:hypothetical protein
MAGPVPAIHVFNCAQESKTWMPGTRPGMTEGMLRGEEKTYAIAGFGAREIASVISAAIMHSAPATKNAGR